MLIGGIKMKTIIAMMILSIVYLVALQVVNKRISALDFTSSSAITYESEDSSYYTVKISGAVANPGTYTVAKGSNLSYLITLAGGLNDDADSSTYNLTTTLTNNTSYYIGKVSSDDEKISINTATLAQLDTLPGIGTVLAGRIISYRTSNGAFESIEDITKVSGIGTTLFEQIKDLICL
jgi:competence protein ComEA